MQEEEAKPKRKLHSGTKLLVTELKKEHLFTLEYYCCFVPLCLCVCVSSAWHVNYRVACARRGKCHSFCDAVPTLLPLPLPLPLHWRRRPCRRAMPIGSVGAQSAATVGGLVCRLSRCGAIFEQVAEIALYWSLLLLKDNLKQYLPLFTGYILVVLVAVTLLATTPLVF